MLWKYDWDANQQISDPLHIGNGRIFLMTSHKLGCAMIDVKRAGDQWQVKEVFKDKRSGALLSNAAFYKGYIYTNASDKYHLQCLDPDGNVKWEGKSPGNTPIIIVDGTIVMLHSRTGTVYLAEASPAGYKELASIKVFEPGKSDAVELLTPPVVDSGKLLVRDLMTLKCLDVAAK
jgi:outer membrane protein assembly factor BamB